MHFLAYFYWDPPIEAFRIPYLDHPVVWYGVLFVIGFILAYFVINPILARFLVQSRHLSALDIMHWPSIIEVLRTSPSPLVSQLMQQCDLSARQQLKQQSPPPITPSLQQGILAGINRLLLYSSTSREELQNLFGKGLASPKQTAYVLTDRLCWFVVLGTIIGARLGTVFFYDWDYFYEHPLNILKIWHGGLASHGGVIGVVIALFLYLKYIQRWVPQLTFLQLLDYVAVPSALVSGFIRLGNFVNQEILGTPTALPWGVIFGHPADGSMPTPLHPIQLYEAAAYFLTFLILLKLWKKQQPHERPGSLVGWLFVLIFGSRFVLEFWKSTQESLLDSTFFLQMGQLLSIPFILLGAFLIWYSKRSHYCALHFKKY